MQELRTTLWIIIVFVAVLSAQEPKYPFPQKVIYPYGVTATEQDALTEHTADWYADWKKKYLQECNGNLRPGVDPLSKSLVEAQGFAMVAVAYMGEKEVFDKLYNFYKSKCSSSTCGLMNWKVNCGGVEPNGQGAATDGDVDVACALVVAHWQWPEAGYDAEAGKVIANLERLIVECGDLSALHPGCNVGNGLWGGCNETDISYYAPAFFRYFADFSDNPDTWKKLADDTHIIRDNAANSNTGLLPDWQSVEGRAGAGSRNAYFGPDAVRAPYKQTMDFLWHGNEQAQTWAKTFTDWIYEDVGVGNFVDGYNLDGSRRGSSHSMSCAGSATVAAMANSQEVFDAFVEDVMKIRTGYWYSAYLGNLYLLAASGNMWIPEIVDPKTGNLPRKKRTVAGGHMPRITNYQNGKILISGLSEGTLVHIYGISGKRIECPTFNRTTGQLISQDVVPGCYVVQITNVADVIRYRSIVTVD